MNFTPSIRERIIGTDEGKKLNKYYQGNLTRENQYRLQGYDNGVDEVNNFFSDLALYESEFKLILGEEVDFNVEEVINEEITEKTTEQTKLLIGLKHCLNSYLEISRNEFGIMMMNE